MKETLKNKLKPLYEKLYQKFGNESFDSELSAFYVHGSKEKVFSLLVRQRMVGKVKKIKINYLLILWKIKNL